MKVILSLLAMIGVCTGSDLCRMMQNEEIGRCDTTLKMNHTECRSDSFLPGSYSLDAFNADTDSLYLSIDAFNNVNERVANQEMYSKFIGDYIVPMITEKEFQTVLLDTVIPYYTAFIEDARCETLGMYDEKIVSNFIASLDTRLTCLRGIASVIVITTYPGK